MYGSLILMAEGATAGLPPWKLLWEARPVCQSWRKITAALFMHGVGGVLPPFGHLVGVDARRLVPAVGLLGDCGRLGDEQARRTALGVVFGHQVVRQASGPGPATGHGGQDDPVRQGQVVQTEGLKEDAVHVLLLTIAGIRILLR